MLGLYFLRVRLGVTTIRIDFVRFMLVIESSISHNEKKN